MENITQMQKIVKRKKLTKKELNEPLWTTIGRLKISVYTNDRALALLDKIRQDLEKLKIIN